MPGAGNQRKAVVWRVPPAQQDGWSGWIPGVQSKENLSEKGTSSCEDGARGSHKRWSEAKIKLLQRTGVKCFDSEELGLIWCWVIS